MEVHKKLICYWKSFVEYISFQYIFMIGYILYFCTLQRFLCKAFFNKKVYYLNCYFEWEPDLMEK